MEKNVQVLDWSLRFFGLPVDPYHAALRPVAEQPHTWPKYQSPVIVAGAEGPEALALRWGVWPFYAREKPQYITNARSDGLLSKTVWKKSAATRRCLVPVSGYYEPGLGPPGARGEVRFTMQARPAFFIAGLWDTDPSEAADRAFAIVTTEPNPYAARFHDRMPVVLADADARTWLGDQPLADDQLLALCRPCPPEIMAHTEIAATPKGKVTRADLSAPDGELQF